MTFILWVIPTLILATIWRGYILSILWAWFIVVGFGLPAMSIPLAIGVSMIVSFLTYQHSKEDVPQKDIVDTWVKIFINSFIYPTILLGVGYIVKGFL
jgi:hypothetical protein